MYGTEISAMPAEKLVKPMARVRSVGGYWNDVKAGNIAFATPVVLLPIENKIKIKVSSEFSAVHVEKCQTKSSPRQNPHKLKKKRMLK